MNAQDPDDGHAQSVEPAWRKYANRNVVFNCLSAVFFVMTAYLLVSTPEWSATGRGAVSFLCAFSCALIGNLDRFESVKASISGIEAKTREMTKAVDEARVALREFHVLAEMTGSLIIELMASAGRIGGTSPDIDARRRSRIIDSLTAIGLSSEALGRVKTSDAFWVKIDYSFGVLHGIQKSESRSVQLKAAAIEANRRWREENLLPPPDDFEAMLREGSCTDAHILELIKDYRHYADNGEHRRPAVWLDRRNWPR
jgi:hypothetical protein